MRIKRDEIISILSLLGGLFNRRKKAAVMASVADALAAYDDVRDLRHKIALAATDMGALTIPAEEVARLHIGLTAFDRLADTIRAMRK